jgi:hypothetical protein
LQLARFEEPRSAGVVCVFTLGHTDLTREDTKSCPLRLSRTTSPSVRYWHLADIRMPPSNAGGLRCSRHKAKARRLGCIVSCVRITSKLSHSVFLGSNAKTSSCRHAHYRGRIVGRRPGAGLLFRPAPCVCVERAGNVFVPRRDSFVYRVVAIRVALVPRIIQNAKLRDVRL